jgi:hypothetical protein
MITSMKATESSRIS